MTEDRIQIPFPEEKLIDGKRIYYYWQWLEQFEKYEKEKRHKTWTIFQASKKCWNRTGQQSSPYKKKQQSSRYKKTTRRFSLGTGTRSNTPNNTIRIPERTGQKQNRQVIPTITKAIFNVKKQIQSMRRFLWAKKSNTETPEWDWQKLSEAEKDWDFPDFSAELPISQIDTSNTDKKLWDKLKNEYVSDVPKNNWKPKHIL